MADAIEAANRAEALKQIAFNQVFNRTKEYPLWPENKVEKYAKEIFDAGHEVGWKARDAAFEVAVDTIHKTIAGIM